MRLLVLGGSGFVGRTVVLDALARGWDVTTFNRGRSAAGPPGARTLRGDRLVPGDLRPLGRERWDVAVDTWAGAPRAARGAAAVLAGRVDRMAYVSSASVLGDPPPRGASEVTAPVAGDPDADRTGYAHDKRGAEIAYEGAFGDRVLLARAGAVLGPHDDVGRLGWWLARMARGGEVLAPGPRDLPLQLIDVRDLARWLLDAALAGHHGPFNVDARPGHATMGSLLEACRAATGGDARLTWVPPAHVAAQGLEAWSDLPLWLPPDHPYRGLHELDVARAHAAGLRCRPAEETVRDTWAWLAGLGGPPSLRPDLPPPGLAPEREAAALAAWHARRD